MNEPKNETNKKASWLELFYDVAFIALVAQLTYLASEYHYTLRDFLNIFLIGYTIFVAWWATTANRNMQPSESTSDKLLIQTQMVAVFLMSIFMSSVFAGEYVGFFATLALVRLLQSVMLIRMYVLHPQTRPVSYNILQGFFAASALWGLSAFVGDPYHFVLAFAALAVDIFVPLTKGKGNTRRYLNVYHLQERLGLFLMLVIGESMIVVALSNSAASELYNQTGIVFSGLGLMIALWWLYFEYADRHAGDRPNNLFAFLHSHGLLFGSIILISVGYKIILDTEAGRTAFLFAIVGMLGIAVALILIRITHKPASVRSGLITATVISVGIIASAFGFFQELYVETIVVLTVVFMLMAWLDVNELFAASKKTPGSGR